MMIRWRGSCNTSSLVQRISKTLSMHINAIRERSSELQGQMERRQELLLEEMMSATWYTSKRRDELLESLAGSRPGDGLADLAFGMIFQKITKSVHQKLQESLGLTDPIRHGAFDPAVGPPRGHDPPYLLEVVWADDLAMAYRCADSRNIEWAMKEITEKVFTECLKHGLVPNLKKGKTEILIIPKGPGSRQVRIDLFGQSDPVVRIPSVPEEFATVRLIAQYRHLGTKIHVGTKLMPEIKSRMGRAWTTFRRMRRQIFQNRLLDLKRRIALFRSMIMSIFEYNLGTWGPLSKGEFRYFSKRLFSFYRGLARAEVHETELRLWNQDRVRALLQLPSPQELLHGARLRYSLSLYGAAPDTLWTLVGCEGKWNGALVEAQGWFLQQLRGYGPDRNGHEWKPDLHQWGLNAGKSMRSWIRKAHEVAQLNHRKWVEWREWHFNIMLDMIEDGVQMEMPWPDNQDDTEEKSEACLRCGKTFPNKAAWAVHAFKAHGRLNRARGLVGGSRCDACSKEFHTTTKLQIHLCNSRRCYDKLILAGCTYATVLPGKNNTREQKQQELTVPPQRSEGPQIQELQHDLQVRGGDFDDSLAETITDAIMGLTSEASLDECVEAIRGALQTSINSFSEVKKTLVFVRDHFDKEEFDPGWPMSYGRLGTALELAVRRCTLTWFFHEDDLLCDPDDQAIRNAAANYATSQRAAARWKYGRDFWSLPRFGARCLVFLHLFSGERRKGDIQEYLERLQVPSGFVLHILSVDVIFDSVAGDLSCFRNQRRWLGFAKAGLIAGIFCSPPCESWSRARAKGGLAGSSYGDGGPRVLRTEEGLVGLDTVKIKEAQQLVLANRLLLFALAMFRILLQLRRFMVVEHPECPSGRHETWMASIWKMFIVRTFMTHDDVHCVSVLQGRFGGESPKPTTLMVACGGDIDAQAVLDTYASGDCMPRALRMGWNAERHEYATASLKEYPPQLCKALAGLAGVWMSRRTTSSFSSGMNEEAMSEFLLFSKELAQGFNSDVGRGADLHIPRSFN